MEKKIDWTKVNQIEPKHLIWLIDNRIKEFYTVFRSETDRQDNLKHSMEKDQEKERADLKTKVARKLEFIRIEKSNLEDEILSEKQLVLQEINSYKKQLKNERNEVYRRIEAAKAERRKQLEAEYDRLNQSGNDRVDGILSSLKRSLNAETIDELLTQETDFTFMQKTAIEDINFATVEKMANQLEYMRGFFARKKAKKYASELGKFSQWVLEQTNREKKELKEICDKDCCEIGLEIKKYDKIFCEKMNQAGAHIKEIENKYEKRIHQLNEEYQIKVQKYTEQKREQEIELNQRLADERKKLDTSNSEALLALYQKFYSDFREFIPRKNLTEYLNYHLSILRPNYERYSCREQLPEQIEIGKLCVDAMPYFEDDAIKEFLMTDYGELFSDGYLKLPYAIDLSEQGNMEFEYGADDDKHVVRDIQSIVISILLEMPVMKVNFVLIDPLKSTNTFAPFNKFIEVNKSSAKLLTGGIVTSEEAILGKLKIVNDHMETIISTCLKSNEMSIQEYNEKAGPNAEPYQIVTIMDFPANFTPEAVKYLEKIVEMGPRCGVYTIIMMSKEQMDSAEPKIKAVYGNIKNRLYPYRFENGRYVVMQKTSNEMKYMAELFDMITDKQIDAIAPVYKKGIADAGRTIIDFNYVQIPREEWFQASTADTISIPIGMVGADQIQSIQLGAKGVSHHALIVGQTGSGKTTLLHAMIMNALMKYSSKELEIYLIDFKRGVEFKIYANYNLPGFKVIAVESEREFGLSVLEHLENEQRRRSGLFKSKKNSRCEDVAEYRELTGETMPRILLVIDEYHELFSANHEDTITAQSADLLSRILAQGRAFGIHVVLATQSIANARGLDTAIYELIAIRIALKCSEAEGKLILGDSADAVNMIDASDSGKAIYNANCGDKDLNSIFRVAYMDSEKQMRLLSEISEVYKELNIIADTRVMLSNVEDDPNNRYIKYADGSDLISSEAVLYLGESLKVSGKFRIQLHPGYGSNLLIIGKNQKQAREMCFYTLLSLMMYQKSNRERAIEIYVYDYGMPERGDTDFFINIDRQIKSDCFYYANKENALLQFRKMYERIISEEAEETYFIFIGLKQARDFRNDRIYSSEYYDMFVELIQKNALLNCHAIVWDDSIKIFHNNYQGLLSYFDERIAFNMPDEDGEFYIDETNCSKLSISNAIYFSAGEGNQKFRPYILPMVEYQENWVYRFAERWMKA